MTGIIHTKYSIASSVLPIQVSVPGKILLPFLPPAPLQYISKMQFTQATVDCLTKNKTKNGLYKETAISNHIGGDPIGYSLSN